MRISNFLRDILVTTATTLVTMVSSILLMRILARGLGPEQFGAYSLVRKFLSSAVPVTSLSMTVALPRYLGVSKNSQNKNSLYFFSALIISLPITAVIAGGLYFGRQVFSLYLFGSKSFVELTAALAFMLFGMTTYRLIYSDYRGRIEMIRANIWQIGVVGIGPLVIAYLFADKLQVAPIVFLFGSLLYLSLVPVIVRFKHLKFSGRNKLKVRVAIRRLFKYGAPRVPGGLAFAGMFALAPFLAPHLVSIEEAGYINLGQSVLRIFGSAVASFGLVALPRLAKLYKDSSNEKFKEKIGNLIAFLFQIGLFATIHIWIWTDLIVIVWLGSEYEAVIPLMRITSIALIPYLSYIVLRSAVNAVEVKAINTRNLLISLLFSGVFSFVFYSLGLGSKGLILGVTFGFVLLGILTIYFLWKRFQFSWAKMYFFRIGLINTAFSVLVVLAHWWVMGSMRGYSSFALMLLMEALLFGVYLGILWIWDVGWIEEFRERIDLD